MDVYNKKRPEQQFPAFDSWGSYDGIPFTSYFESASHHVFRHYSYSDNDDLYRCTYNAAIPFQTSGRIVGREKGGSKESWVNAADLNEFPRTRAACLSRPNQKPVDVDLYQIPVQLVHAKAKSKKRRSGFFTRCLLPAICA